MKLLVAILFLISAASAAQKCYTCSTTTKPACENLSDLSNIDTCVSTASEGVNCLMYKFRINGRDLDIVYRGCLTKDITCDDEKAALQKEKKEMLDL
ncbi:hypothetical protein TcasGA2_TC034837 [Tribolium castaneum]|uniref:Uncharacterized protein n=1 Tax=Tribolium castaneum TaxID=7070 RepID=A0A139WD18_TRICA|nr:hypothetical protein TcasGA2_TC034837 [Tribolium castaneum]